MALPKFELRGNRKRTVAEKTVGKTQIETVKPVVNEKPVFTDGFVCFHLITESNRVLSNWYSAFFEIDGVKYSSAEQYFMYKKAMTFGDTRTAKLLLATNNPQKIKMYGRQVKNYNEKIWHGVRAVTLYEGLLAKFSQNPALRDFLLETGDAILCECTKSDLVWANGMEMTNPDRTDIDRWRGDNLLGFILMKVRDKLK